MFSSTKQANSVVNDKSKNSFALLLSYASNFRSDKLKDKKYAQEQQAGNEKKKEDQKHFTEHIKEFQQIDNLAVNPQYNFNYNYISELPNDDPEAMFYLNAPAFQMTSTKSSFKDKSQMSRTAGSFYNGNSNSNSKVTFKEPLRATSEIDRRNPAFQSNFGRDSLRSAK